MEHTSLYRKYRPATWEDVRGQDEIVAVLRAAIEKGAPAQAYLFAGSRGTGKTSTARILARALGTSEKDLYEMDAASNRGVDDIRELRDGVATLPFDSKYKVYIIDEAHMLTKEAFNALLKTLEEPPAHVIFILATTELDRMPETIQSRCQVFRFKKPSTEILKAAVLDVAKKEKATLSPASAELIAIMGDGSFRDTLGILQKVLTISGDKKLSDEEAARVVGAPPASEVNAFLTALAGKDVGAALESFSRSLAGGAEPKTFVLLVINKVRAILLLRFAPSMEKQIAEQFGPEDFVLLQTLASKDGAAINASLLAELLTALIDMNHAPIPAIALELALYRVSGEK
ncbi:MAG: DNA polymerase III subunit gamma/tau [Minisyncoccia bacterium]